MSSSSSNPLALESALKIYAVQQKKTQIQENEASSAPTRRIQAVVDHTAASKEGDAFLLVLPDGGKVTVSRAQAQEGPNEIILNGSLVLSYTISETQSFALDISSIGTPYEGATTHIPKYKLLTLSAPKSATSGPKEVSIPDFWVAIYALFMLYHTQENIPFVFSLFPNAQEINQYLITTGLARTYPTSEVVPRKTQVIPDALFLSHAAFWQGAGTTGFHRRGWLVNPQPIFPRLTAYTRNEKVIAMHPLRPTKPQPGEVLYRRWCSHVQQMFEIAYFDLPGVHDGTQSAGGGGLSRHMAAFHRWHNDERVNNAWGERGSLEKHREYVESMLADPHALPCMLSWDGELMGYVEIVYTKEDHVAQHYPADVVPGDWERGFHILIGESKFLGGGRSEVWMRSLVHYIFLADPRTDRIIGEPNQGNAPMVKIAINAGYHIQTIIDFPYKRSALALNPREKFFRLCRLR